MAFHFGEFELDPARRLLLREGEPCAIQAKHFELLELLLEAAPAVVSKDDLYARLWPDVVVEEANLPNLVSELRKVIGAQWIRTVHRRGYAFAVRPREDRLPTPWSLVLGRETLPLVEGENRIGRDEGVEVPIDAPGISRRHAKLTIAGDSVVVEDLGSKNGTWLGTERLTAPAAVHDGDRILLGSIALILRKRAPLAPTRTDPPEL